MTLRRLDGMQYLTTGDGEKLDAALATEDLEFIVEAVEHIIELRVREALRKQARHGA